MRTWISIAGLLLFAWTATRAGTGSGPVVPPATNVFLTNSLGMAFKSVPGIRARFALWEVRVRDYRRFIEATDRDWQSAGFEQGPDHPAVNLSWEDATAFCSWLTGEERNAGLLKGKQRYRLPTDLEWTAAVTAPPSGTSTTPEARMRNERVWPWGSHWPPLANDGNYGADLGIDTFTHTAPVASFKPNAHGLYDMGGNVWEWCEDWFNNAGVTKVLRGGSFNDSSPKDLLSSYRFSGTMNLYNEDIGLRVVLDE